MLKFIYFGSCDYNVKSFNILDQIFIRFSFSLFSNHLIIAREDKHVLLRRLSDKPNSFSTHKVDIFFFENQDVGKLNGIK